MRMAAAGVVVKNYEQLTSEETYPESNCLHKIEIILRAIPCSTELIQASSISSARATGSSVSCAMRPKTKSPPMNG
jgi:hypothetical protein